MSLDLLLTNVLVLDVIVVAGGSVVVVLGVSVSLGHLILDTAAVLVTTAELGKGTVGENQTDRNVESEEREDDSENSRSDGKTIRITTSTRELVGIDSVEDPGKSLEEEARELNEPEL